MAVTAIEASVNSVLQGEVVEIFVTVENLGTAQETFTLTLRDDTEDREINSEIITLEAAQRLTIRISWDTTLAGYKAHKLTAAASMSGDENPANDSKSLEQPITVVQEGITLGDGTGQNLPEAFLDTHLTRVDIATMALSSTAIFIGAADTDLDGTLASVIVATDENPQPDIFVANADAIFESDATFFNPFSRGEVQGIAHLEGVESSTGISVHLGADVHHVNADGSFRFDARPGIEDIVIQAPGHVPVLISQAQINAGELLTLPELTLPFGDANGDGKIDILDLSMAADNFGATTEEITLP